MILRPELQYLNFIDVIIFLWLSPHFYKNEGRISKQIQITYVQDFGFHFQF